MILGHPGVGKTRSIRVGKQLLSGLPDTYVSPISMTWASLVDSLVDAKRYVIRPGQEEIKYNSMYVCADELGAFIHKYDHEMIDGLSAFYDPIPYSQRRRTDNLKIKIESPQLNLLTGSTPQNLLDMMPEKAWGQGFMSRVIMVFSDERIIGNDFAPGVAPHLEDLAKDLETIASLYGQFHITKSYEEAVNEWRSLGEPPIPGHPKLIHYNTRRRVNIYKLSMIAAIDKGNALVLTKDEFMTAGQWLMTAEREMPNVFQAGATNADGQAMDEILHFILITDRGKGVPATAINRFACDRLPIHSIMRIIQILEQSGQIVARGIDKITKVKYYSKAKSE